MGQHEAKSNAYTAKRLPLELVWTGEFETRHEAIAFEQQIKGWSRAKKEAMMQNNWQELQALAQSKSS